MKRLYSFILMCFTLATYYSSAQSDSTEENTPQLKLSVNYNSNLNYYGRTDSLRSSGVFPMLEFWASPKFYINATPIFVTNKVQSFDYAGTVITTGYQSTSDKWLSNIYATKPFYKSDTRLVQSALQAQTGVSLTFLNSFLNITAGGDAKFSNQVDFGATAGLDHLIRIEKGNSVFVIDPSAYVYAGTQRFTNTYYKKKRGFLVFPGDNQQVTENVQRFNVLAYEASVPVIFVKGKVQVLATPSYIIPQNLITDAQSPALKEKGENTFYTTFGVKYTF